MRLISQEEAITILDLRLINNDNLQQGKGKTEGRRRDPEEWRIIGGEERDRGADGYGQ